MQSGHEEAGATAARARGILVCVVDRAGLGAGGTYVIDAALSRGAGADYGGARLDLVARAADGREIEIAQAHQAASRPDVLTSAIITLRPRAGDAGAVFRFEDLRREPGASCP
ncbi:MAG: hypothetical protein H6745_12525 [Deltaproteobacteria bacterium]|nr:hypothetical protein [Deltaproteobacteria bacterium]